MGWLDGMQGCRQGCRQEQGLPWDAVVSHPPLWGPSVPQGCGGGWGNPVSAAPGTRTLPPSRALTFSGAKSPESSGGGRLLPLSGSCRVGGSWTSRALIDYTEDLDSPRARGALAGGSVGKARAARRAGGDGRSPRSPLTPLPAEVGGRLGRGTGMLLGWLERGWGCGSHSASRKAPRGERSPGEAGRWVQGVLGSGCSAFACGWLFFWGMRCRETELGQRRQLPSCASAWLDCVPPPRPHPEHPQPLPAPEPGAGMQDRECGCPWDSGTLGVARCCWVLPAPLPAAGSGVPAGHRQGKVPSCH